MTKKPDCGNEIVVQLDDKTDSLKRSVFLDRILGVLDRADTGTSNKVDIKALDGVDTGDSNDMVVTMEPYSEDRVVGGVENKVDTGKFYRLHLFILKDNYAKNLLFCKLADVLENFFDDLSSTLTDFCSSPAFFVSFSYLATFNGTNGRKLLDSISLGGLAICNLGNILAFYYWLFAYLTIQSSTNVVSTDSSHLFSDSIKVE